VEIRARDGNNTTTVANVVRDIFVRRLSADAEIPTVTLDAPAEGATLPLSVVSVSGTAADDSGVASIETAVQHTATGNWWTGSAWSPTETWFTVTPTSVGATSTAWSWPWTPPAAGGYTIRARSVDLVANRSDVSSSGITVDIGGPDTVAPNGTVSGLVNNQTLPLGPITFGGGATDNVGLANVQVGIQNRTTLRWWKASTGTWVTTFTWNSGSTLSMPGASPTSWTYLWTPATTGNYTLTVRAIDAAGNFDASRPWINFTVA
jgi:hypothetical protein